MYTYTFIGSKKEHSKCQLTPTEGARKSTASVYLYLHREQERVHKCLTTTTQGARKSTASVYLHLHREQERAQQVPNYTFIGSKKEHSKCLLTST